MSSCTLEVYTDFGVQPIPLETLNFCPWQAAADAVAVEDVSGARLCGVLKHPGLNSFPKVLRVQVPNYKVSTPKHF